MMLATNISISFLRICDRDRNFVNAAAFNLHAINSFELLQTYVNQWNWKIIEQLVAIARHYFKYGKPG